MNDVAIIVRYLAGLIKALFIALVLLPGHLAFDAGKAVGQEVARVKANW